MTAGEYKIAPIRNGTVIDHIKPGQALNVLKILGINENTIDSSVVLAMNVFSKKGIGRKDIVKVEDRELCPTMVNKIALISPDANIVIIRDYYTAEKYKVHVDDHIKGLARCSNPNCITNVGEPVDPEFDVISRDPPVLRCMYCERYLTDITNNLL
ncbi:MAG: aspartate carbamoyltransferase regulatory subunit [archaeon]|nr:aspartate carbamoyltransferase regulatory subunit [archaeon]